MSRTPVDYAKVTQMLDSGWRVSVCRMDGSYVAIAVHDDPALFERAKQEQLKRMRGYGWEKEEAEELVEADFGEPLRITTDDFTPEQALTRLAYKIHGEII